MLVWANILSGFLKVVQFFQRRSEADRNIQTGKDQCDAKTLRKIEQGRRVRDRLANDAEFKRLLLLELGLGGAEPDDDRQLLSELRSCVSQGSRSSKHPRGYITELRNVPATLYRYSKFSLGKLSTCHCELQLVALELSRTRDSTVVGGTRSIAEQQELFDKGLSRVPAGKSLHNRLPSDAMDIVPVEAPALWAKGEDLSFEEYRKFADELLAIAKANGIELRWGGDWDGDGDSTDQTFMDYGHFERVLK